MLLNQSVCVCVCLCMGVGTSVSVNVWECVGASEMIFVVEREREEGRMIKRIGILTFHRMYRKHQLHICCLVPKLWAEKFSSVMISYRTFSAFATFHFRFCQSSQVRLKSIEKMATRWLFVHLTFRFWPKIQQQVPWWHNWLSLNYLENKRPGFQASCCLFENQTVKDEVEPTWLELQWIQNDFK